MYFGQSYDMVILGNRTGDWNVFTPTTPKDHTKLLLTSSSCSKIDTIMKK